jgi:SAV_6107-like HEPN
MAMNSITSTLDTRDTLERVRRVPSIPNVPRIPRIQRANLPAALGLLASARHGLDEAATSSRPAQRYASAHLAALRAAAAVLAARARPEIQGVRRVRRSRNAWVLLTQVAPELAEWAAFFAAGAGKRAAAEAGLDAAVTARESDDLVRDAEIFLALVETTIGVIHQPALPVDAVRAS